jgi:hypothetical protein
VTSLLDVDVAGKLSLRQAIQDANANPGADIINFDPSLKGTITLSSGQLTITDALTINGSGASVITVSGAGTRIFQINAGVRADISGLTIANGNANFGGGIANTGTLTIKDSTLSSNTAAAYGGGIYNTGLLTIINSTLDSNSGSQERETGAGGGAIYNAGTLNVTSSTLMNNMCGGGWSSGGGIYNNSGATSSVVNSTLSGNYAPVGGGVYNAGALSIRSSTITTNSASVGGGIYTTADSSATLDMRNTILAGNTVTIQAGTGRDLYGTLTASGYNLIGNTSGGGGYASTDRLNVNPRLGPLQDNSGPTFTHALLSGSPAIDAGDNTGAPATDQRGLPRIVDGNQDGTPTIDIGAYELQSQQSQASTTTILRSSANPSAFGQSVTFTATVSANASGSGTPTGSVTFKDGTTVLGSGTLSGGVATFTTKKLAVGSHQITATYNGATNFKSSTSPVLTQAVNK